MRRPRMSVETQRNSIGFTARGSGEESFYRDRNEAIASVVAKIASHGDCDGQTRVVVDQNEVTTLGHLSSIYSEIA